MGLVGCQNEDYMDLGVVDSLLGIRRPMRNRKLGGAVTNVGGRDIAYGLDLEEMREEEEAWAVADLEDFLCTPVGTVSNGSVIKRPGASTLTPAPMMPTPSFCGTDMVRMRHP